MDNTEGTLKIKANTLQGGSNQVIQCKITGRPGDTFIKSNDFTLNVAKDDKKASVNVAVIVGATVGAVAFTGVVTALVILIYKKKLA